MCVPGETHSDLRIGSIADVAQAITPASRAAASALATADAGNPSARRVSASAFALSKERPHILIDSHRRMAACARARCRARAPVPMTSIRAALSQDRYLLA